MPRARTGVAENPRRRRLDRLAATQAHHTASLDGLGEEQAGEPMLPPEAARRRRRPLGQSLPLPLPPARQAALDAKRVLRRDRQRAAPAPADPRVRLRCTRPGRRRARAARGVPPIRIRPVVFPCAAVIAACTNRLPATRLRPVTNERAELLHPAAPPTRRYLDAHHRLEKICDCRPAVARLPPAGQSALKRCSGPW